MEKNKKMKIHLFLPLYFQLHWNSTTYTKQWEGIVSHHGISNAIDYQFATCKVMAMRVVPPKTPTTRVPAGQENNNNNTRGFM
jgi:hypothetical protein